MKKNNEIITNDIDKFPEFENIRNAILEAREKVATTVRRTLLRAAHVSVYSLPSLPAGSQLPRSLWKTRKS